MQILTIMFNAKKFSENLCHFEEKEKWFLLNSAIE